MNSAVSKEKLQEIFKVYDEKRTGQIRTDQVTKLIRSAKLFPSEDDIIWLQKAVDPQRQGYFSINKFVEVGLEFAEAQSHINHEQQLLKAFSFFDEQQNGYISETDLKKIMAAFGEPLNEEETREILKYARSVNGKIFYRDFVRTIINVRFIINGEWKYLGLFLQEAVIVNYSVNDFRVHRVIKQHTVIKTNHL